MTQINVLYMIDSLGNGGSERQLDALIRNMDSNRCKPHLCTLKKSSDLFDSLNVPKIVLDFQSFTDWSVLKVIYNLRKFIKANRIQIIHTFFQDSFLLAAITKILNDVMLVGSFRDLGFWRTETETRKMRFTYQFFSGFIANSQAVKDHFVTIDGIHPNKIEVIYNGIDCPKTIESREVETQNKPGNIIGIVANLNRPVKRVDDFIRAAEIVLKKIPDASFVVVGGGHLKSEFENLSKDLGISNRVNFTGNISNPLEVIPTFNIGVITSETEGFCNAIMEYMACGVPVIATAVGGNPELIENGINGILFPAGDYEQLAKNIIELLSDRLVCTSMGISGKNRVLNCFSVIKMTSGYRDYYETKIK